REGRGREAGRDVQAQGGSVRHLPGELRHRSQAVVVLPLLLGRLRRRDDGSLPDEGQGLVSAAVRIDSRIEVLGGADVPELLVVALLVARVADPGGGAQVLGQAEARLSVAGDAPRADLALVPEIAEARGGLRSVDVEADVCRDRLVEPVDTGAEVPAPDVRTFDVRLDRILMRIARQ